MFHLFFRMSSIIQYCIWSIGAIWIKPQYKTKELKQSVTWIVATMKSCVIRLIDRNRHKRNNVNTEQISSIYHEIVIWFDEPSSPMKGLISFGNLFISLIACMSATVFSIIMLAICHELMVFVFGIFNNNQSV